LPFQNMSGDPEQEYFADGMVEDIITALSRFESLFVIARNSSFTYKGKAVDIKQVGRELGVRYVLEGSVRKSGLKVRITGQLIDAASGTHLWADRFDGSLEDIFDLQDQVATSVVGLITPRVEQAEIERIKRKPTEKLDAYDIYLQGLAELYRFSKASISEALRLFGLAIERDPRFALPYAMTARIVCIQAQNGWLEDTALEFRKGVQNARRSIELERDNPTVLATAGFAIALLDHDNEGGARLIAKSLSLNSNSAIAWLFSGWVNILLGQPDVGIEDVSRAQRLSPVDPLQPQFMTATACGHFIAGRYADAISWATNAVHDRSNLTFALALCISSMMLSGKTVESVQQIVRQLLQYEPNYRISSLSQVSFHRPDDRERLSTGLRLAGLPD
jgi:TolB-like protein